MNRTSLRLRLIFTFALGTLVLSVTLTSITYIGVRRALEHQQFSIDLAQTINTATLTRSTLEESPLALNQLISGAEQDTNSSVFLAVHGQWLGPSVIPPPYLTDTAVVQVVARQKIATQVVTFLGNPYYVVGLPVPSIQTDLFEVFPLRQLNDNLSNLLVLLIVAGSVTTLLGLVGGVVVSGRSVRPLRLVAVAAERISNGDLDARIPEVGSGNEVRRLSHSFNVMVDQLSTRLERDARFASDVTHELRSPLTGLAMSASLLSAEADRLSPSAQESLRILNADLAVFRNLVEDLLEMARMDAGGNNLTFEFVPVGPLVHHCVAASVRRLDIAPPTVTVADEAQGAVVRVDRRRFERVIANLFANAENYAGGVTEVLLDASNDEVTVTVNDDGPGIAASEREAVFERFFRGQAAHDRGEVQGTGIGLALAREHVLAFGGTLTVDESPTGGAQFRIVLPRTTEEFE